MRRDFSLVLDESIGWEKIDRALAGLRIPELVEWRAREVFRDAKLGAGEYSLLLGATFQAAGPHAARGGAAELPGAGGGGCWQSWGAAAKLAQESPEIGAILPGKRVFARRIIRCREIILEV